MESTKLAGAVGTGEAGPVRVLTDVEEPGKALRYRNPDVTAGNLFVAIGSGLAAVGVVDLGLLWFPMQLGSPGWEFAAVSRTFTNAPMTMVGLVLVAFGLVRRGTRPAIIRGAAVGFGALALLFVAMGALYALAAPAVLFQASGEAAVEALKRAMVKNGVEIVAYPTVLVGIAVILWRGVTDQEHD